MARKSRKETAALVVQEADAACRAAIYVRLSVEDTHTHSVSIETQQMIIARYLEQYPEISVYDTYIDNGATGTNFHRPGFQQMLSDIEAGHVNCVIVKDLSRLGRNTIDTGYYRQSLTRPPAAPRRERSKPSRRIFSKARCSAPIAAAACTGRETSARSPMMCTSTIV